MKEIWQNTAYMWEYSSFDVAVSLHSFDRMSLYIWHSGESRMLLIWQSQLTYFWQYHTIYTAGQVYVLVRLWYCWCGSHCESVTLLLWQSQFMYLWEYSTIKVAVTCDILLTVWHCWYSRHSLYTCESTAQLKWQSHMTYFWLYGTADTAGTVYIFVRVQHN